MCEQEPSRSPYVAWDRGGRHLRVARCELAAVVGTVYKAHLDMASLRNWFPLLWVAGVAAIVARIRYASPNTTIVPLETGSPIDLKGPEKLGRLGPGLDGRGYVRSGHATVIEGVRP